MTPDRWRKVDELFAAALERDREERATFLDQVCGDDADLRREVEKMLKFDERAADFIETDVFDLAAGLMTGEARESSPARVLAERKKSARQPQSSFTSDSIDDARFIPGNVLAERYRIVGLLGRGGMGEVYRADDLKLKQPVALKFLPESLSAHGAALARFYKEVSVARQISHRHVCRVYDVGEFEGQHFISMEFVRGEELSSLLKRIGHLPQDKAVEIARQLCAGLAAVHERGVLHRDLKPANIMVDERGDVRITDFGIAALAEEVTVREAIAGTPAYMSPEQLEGQELTVKSDIYSLGLVLYEVFTGKKAFEASSLPELLRLRRSDTTPTSPSELVANLDPLVERVIFRCLEQDPAKRPASALQVAAALPGGDPLAAALAAGETPSPQMVAAAPKEGGLRPAIAIVLFASIIVGLALSLVAGSETSLHAFTPLEKPPDLLRERAREITLELGYPNPTVDDEYEFGFDHAAHDYIAQHDSSPDRWRKLKTGQPAVVFYWYRQSTSYLEPFLPGGVSVDNPPPIQSGMSGARLDMRGRLLRFYAVPPQVEDSGAAMPAEAQAFDWSPLFKAAGFELANFRATESKWLPPYPFDARAAWEGVYPENPQIPLRVEAASYRGKPVYFEVVNPWDKPSRQESQGFSTRGKALLMLAISLFAAMVVGTLLLAVRNLQRGRGDRKGALRLALFIFTSELLWLWSAAHHVPTLYEFGVIITTLPFALFSAFFFSLLYLALEPSVRRRRPHSLISWQRLLAGGFRDPMVGRDFLVGALAGIGIIAFNMLPILPAWLTGRPFQPAFEPGDVLLGLDFFLAAFATQLRTSFFFSIPFLFLLQAFSMLLRSDWRGAVASWVIVALSLGLISESWISAPVAAAIIVWVMYRYGWLALSVMMVFFHICIFFPLSTDLAAWYMRGTVFNLLILLAASAYAFRISLGGQKLLRSAFPDD